jgi:protein-tyrosine-phosphatase
MRRFNILILCTGNSARTILAEALLRRLAYSRFHAYSAGSHATGTVHPDTIELLRAERYDTSAFCSKKWDEFAQPGAPKMDIVITVCDAVAGEACPIWPGQPVRVHWGLPDPAKVTDPEERRAAFRATYGALERRITALLALSDAQLADPKELAKVHAEADL